MIIYLRYRKLYELKFKRIFQWHHARSLAKCSFLQEPQCRSSSRPEMFFKTGVLKNFANFTGKHLCWSLFLIKLQA